VFVVAVEVGWMRPQVVIRHVGCNVEGNRRTTDDWPGYPRPTDSSPAIVADDPRKGEAVVASHSSGSNHAPACGLIYPTYFNAEQE